MRQVIAVLILWSSAFSGFVIAGEYNEFIDYSREAAKATGEREREQYLIRQGSTRSQKFSVHESAKPKAQRSVILHGGPYNAGQGMSYAEKEGARNRALKRYNEALASGSIPPRNGDLAGDQYKSELQALLKSLKLENEG